MLLHFVILFAIVCLFQPSFTWIVNNIEEDAVQESIYKRSEEAKIIERSFVIVRGFTWIQLKLILIHNK